MTFQFQVGEVENDFFMGWLLDNIDALPVAEVRIRPVRGHNSPHTVCVISSTIGIRCVSGNRRWLLIVPNATYSPGSYP